MIGKRSSDKMGCVDRDSSHSSGQRRPYDSLLFPEGEGEHPYRDQNPPPSGEGAPHAVRWRGIERACSSYTGKAVRDLSFGDFLVGDECFEVLDAVVGERQDP